MEKFNSNFGLLVKSKHSKELFADVHLLRWLIMWTCEIGFHVTSPINWSTNPLPLKILNVRTLTLTHSPSLSFFRSSIQTCPSPCESSLIHTMFLETLDPKRNTFRNRVKPANSVWMDETMLKNVLINHPQVEKVQSELGVLTVLRVSAIWLIVPRAGSFAFFQTFTYCLPFYLPLIA